MNEVRERLYRAFLDPVPRWHPERILGFRVRPLTLWHWLLIERLAGEMGDADEFAALWMQVQILRLRPNESRWRLWLSLWEPARWGLQAARARRWARRWVEDGEAVEAPLLRHRKRWDAIPLTRSEVGGDGKAKGEPIRSHWVSYQVALLQQAGMTFREALATPPGLALHLTWSWREAAGERVPIYSAQMLEEEEAAWERMHRP